MITIVSALKAEIAPFLDHYSVAEKTLIEGGSLYQTPGRWYFLRSGVGLEQAAKVLTWYMKRYHPHLLINIGFAGSLSPEIAPGRLFFINKIHSILDGTVQMPALPPVAMQSCSLLTAGKAVLSDTERATLHLRFGADLVDMEAYELARIARQHQIPFYCFKMVSDDAGNDGKEQFLKNYRVLAVQLFKRINPVLEIFAQPD